MGYRSLSYTKPLWELTDLPLYRSKICLQDPDLIEKKSQGYSSSRNPIDRKTRATVLSNNNIPFAQVEKPSYYKQYLVIKNYPEDFLSLPSYRMLSREITYHFNQKTMVVVQLVYCTQLHSILYSVLLDLKEPLSHSLRLFLYAQ